jgi:hypothetical protein
MWLTMQWAVDKQILEGTRASVSTSSGELKRRALHPQHHNNKQQTATADKEWACQENKAEKWSAWICVWFVC